MKWCHVFPEARAPQKANNISRVLQAEAVSCAPELGRDIVIWIWKDLYNTCVLWVELTEFQGPVMIKTGFHDLP